MDVDERGRLELADAAKRASGGDAGITLMELISPVGRVDVAYAGRFFPEIERWKGRTMSVDERNRLQLAEAKRVLGADEGITLMELLPPVGWADVATRHDLLALEQRIGLRFEAQAARIDTRFTQIDGRFAQIDARVDSMKHETLGTMERELRKQTWRFLAINTATMSPVLGALVAVVKF